MTEIPLIHLQYGHLLAYFYVKLIQFKNIITDTYIYNCDILYTYEWFCP